MYVIGAIVYVSVCCVYVENTHFPRILRRFQQNLCMLRQFCELFFLIVRFCIAISMLSGSNTYVFSLQYLCFQPPISMTITHPTFMEGLGVASFLFGGVGGGFSFTCSWWVGAGFSFHFRINLMYHSAVGAWPHFDLNDHQNEWDVLWRIPFLNLPIVYYRL